MTRPRLRHRIRDAWNVLRGNADVVERLFQHGMNAGQHIAYLTFTQTGIVLDPYAEPATGAAT